MSRESYIGRYTKYGEKTNEKNETKTKTKTKRSNKSPILAGHIRLPHPARPASPAVVPPFRPKRTLSMCSAMCRAVGQSKTVVDDTTASASLIPPATQPPDTRCSWSLPTNSSAVSESKPASNRAWSGEMVSPWGEKVGVARTKRGWGRGESGCGRKRKRSAG